MKNVTSLEQALDQLYGDPPATFTKTRDVLAKSLAANGHQADAATLKAAKKPSMTAYALNQLARRYPDDVEALVDIGRELARAQRKALRGGSGGGDELREAITRQRGTLGVIIKKMGALLRELGVAEAHLAAIAGALQSALVDPRAAEALEAGRLETVPETAAGFLGAEHDEEVAAAPPSPQPRAPKPSSDAKTSVAKATADAKQKAKVDAKAKADAKQKAQAEAHEKAKADAEEKARAKADAKQKADAHATELRAVAARDAAAAEDARRAAKAAATRAQELVAEARRSAAAARRAERAARA